MPYDDTYSDLDAKRQNISMQRKRQMGEAVKKKGLDPFTKSMVDIVDKITKPKNKKAERVRA